MITITDAVRSILSTDDIALQALHAGILNLSAYADTIYHAVEEKTWKQVKKGTLVVALTRIAAEQHDGPGLRPVVVLDDVSIHSALCDLTYTKTELSRQKLATLSQQIVVDEHAFFTSTQSMSEITIVAPQSLMTAIQEHFVETPKAVCSHLVGITVRFSQEYLSVPNVLYTIQAVLAVHKINFTEVISTYTEFSFILNKKDAEVATRSLQAFLA